ncbi:putative secreted protein [Corynebacterium ulcerans 0102]|nr:putative secreted protein [Corynebacterium ulcerans 0102]
MASAQVSAIVVRLVLVLGEAVNFMVSFRQVVG